ncbi:hypothetical protein [Microbulbifer sp. SAOS-129_SWC]|uniref:hypothetical protein n=1 Tax=Microbulbifer sp. SAOS-129_SWC TaxID=3145235 RepID=UPI00321749FB
MKFPQVKIDGVMVLALLAAAGLVWLYSKRADAAKALTPTSDQNLAYSAVNAVGDVLNDGSDNNDFSLGSWIYEVTHPGDAELFLGTSAAEASGNPGLAIIDTSNNGSKLK